MTGPERIRTLSALLPQDVEESVADEDEELLEVEVELVVLVSEIESGAGSTARKLVS